MKFVVRIPITDKIKIICRGYWFLLDNINPISAPLPFILRSSCSSTTDAELILTRRDTQQHKVDRVLSFFSSRPNWDPLTRRQECPPPLVTGGGTLAYGEEVGGPNSDEGTDTMEL